MDLAKLNDWMQVLGIFALVASLIFVGLQMKQGHEIALAGQFQERSATAVEFWNGASHGVNSVLRCHRLLTPKSPLLAKSRLFLKGAPVGIDLPLGLSCALPYIRCQQLAVTRHFVGEVDTWGYWSVEKAKDYLKATLQVFGAIFVILLIGTIIIVYSSLRSLDPNKERPAIWDDDDVLFVLNWGGLNADQDFSVLFGSDTPPLWNGDYASHYCIQLSEFEPDESHSNGWIRGPEKDVLFAKAREIATRMGNATQCFGRVFDADSPNVAAYIWAVRTHSRRVSGFEIILHDDLTNRLLFVGHET